MTEDIKRDSDDVHVADGPSRRTLLTNTLFVFGGTAGTAISQALAGVLLLVILSKYHYGVLTSAVAWIDPLRRLAVFGLDAIGLRRAALEPDRANEVVSTLVTLRAGLSLVCFVAVLILAPTLRADAPGGAVALIAAALVLIPASVAAPLQVSFQARHQNRQLLGMPMVSGIAQVLALGGLYLADASVVYYIAAISTTEVVNALFVFLLLRRDQGHFWRAFEPALAREMLREAAPLAYSYLVVMLYKRIGFYMVEAQHGVEAVGALGAAVQLSSPAVGLGGALSVSMGAYAASLASRRQLAELRGAAIKTVAKVLLILGPLTLILAVFAIPVAERWAPEYRDAALAYIWMSTAGLFMFVARTATSIIVALGRTSVMTYLVTFDLLVFSALAWWLVPGYGPEGAAMATFFMEGINSAIQCGLVLLYTRVRVPLA
ncbi:MAG: oligosaccharide flippase family protein [Deltaproteobacteria bacterium]|nr:oligosaccharide flippase family protein [Deltaproteobacteria bacterium]